MVTAPAKMISKEQTVAKIGRLMKKSTKTVHLFPKGAQLDPDFFGNISTN